MNETSPNTVIPDVMPAIQNVGWVDPGSEAGG
jgi:hypothetical protein